ALAGAATGRFVAGAVGTAARRRAGRRRPLEGVAGRPRPCPALRRRTAGLPLRGQRGLSAGARRRPRRAAAAALLVGSLPGAAVRLELGDRRGSGLPAAVRGELAPADRAPASRRPGAARGGSSEPASRDRRASPLRGRTGDTADAGRSVHAGPARAA